MERRSEMTKALLGEKFKELVVEKSFDKLTIKMITDAAGVIRPTFYNYFQDKYEVMEWLLNEDIFKSVTELIDMEMDVEAMKMLFRKFELDKAYYAKVFEVEGQNSFEEMLFDRVYKLVEKIIKKHPLKVEDKSEIISEEIFLKFQTITLVNGIKYWITYDKKQISADEALKFYEFLMTHSLLDIVDNDIWDKVIN
ncbi:TetR family transcriptional regulator [Bariatricus sp. SGI.154]|uniref:TetR family transcriptional regulator n=1 Tax=Bariatricus sp. SGI.154 TaxID=3420549 RepID=UPI003D053021